MAYNPYFINPYQPNYYGQINQANPNPYAFQQMQVQQAQQQGQQLQGTQMSLSNQQPQQIQQSGFVLVQSEQEARSYPVAPGNSITFKDESQPYCYVKTMGFNQLDRPVFEKYRLVKEDALSEPTQSPVTQSQGKEDKDIQYALKSDLDELRAVIAGMQEKMKMQSEKKPAKKKIIEVEADEDDAE